MHPSASHVALAWSALLSIIVAGCGSSDDAVEGPGTAASASAPSTDGTPIAGAPTVRDLQELDDEIIANFGRWSELFAAADNRASLAAAKNRISNLSNELEKIIADLAIHRQLGTQATDEQKARQFSKDFQRCTSALATQLLDRYDILEAAPVKSSFDRLAFVAVTNMPYTNTHITRFKEEDAPMVVYFFEGYHTFRLQNPPTDWESFMSVAEPKVEAAAVSTLQELRKQDIFVRWGRNANDYPKADYGVVLAYSQEVAARGGLVLMVPRRVYRFNPAEVRLALLYSVFYEYANPPARVLDAMKARAATVRSLATAAANAVSGPADGAGVAATGDLEEAGFRTWSDLTGQFKIEAVLVRLQDGKVTLRKRDGQTVAVPIERLSPSDQAHVTAIQTQIR